MVSIRDGKIVFSSPQIGLLLILMYVRTLIIIIVTIRNIIYLFVLEEYLAPLQRGHKSSNAINFGNVVAEQ